MNVIECFLWVSACIVCFFVGRSLGFKEALDEMRNVFDEIIRVEVYKTDETWKDDAE